MNLKKLTVLAGAALGILAGPALTDYGTAAAAGKFAWQKEVVCKRSALADPVAVAAGNLSADANENAGCFGGPAKNCDLRMYQIMVESYLHGEGGAMGYGYAWGPSQHDGNLKGIIESLPYIKSTGANAVLLSPIFKTEMVQNQDSEFYKLDGTGYFTSDYFQVEPKFGTMDEFRELVNKAHALGLRVILDVALGHSKVNVTATSPAGNKLLVDKQCLNIRGGREIQMYSLATCFNTALSLDYLKEVVAYWVKEAKIDGWKFDKSFEIPRDDWKAIRSSLEQESAKSANAYKLAGRQTQPAAFMTAYVPTNTLKDYNDYVLAPGGLGNALSFPTRNAAVRVFAARESLSAGDCGKPASHLNEEVTKLGGLSPEFSATGFISGHEVVRFGDLLQRAGYEKDGAKGDSYYDAHRAAFSFLASMSGPLVIYYGDEFGEDMPNFAKQVPSKCNEINQCDDHVSRTQARTSGFSAAETALKNDVAEYMNLRDAHKSLSNGTRRHIYSDESVYIDLKQSGKDRVLYVLNAGTAPREITIGGDVWQAAGLGTCGLTKLVGKGSVSSGVIQAPALSGTFFGASCR